MTSGHDLIVVGAGPVGLAVAILARSSGLHPLVIERRPDVSRKACGEGIMPSGVAALATMGVDIPPDERHPFTGIRYIEDELVAVGRFPGEPGLGVARHVLSRALLARARELEIEVRLGDALLEWRADASGVSVVTQSTSERGRILVGADGLHSTVRESAGLSVPASTPLASRRFGVRRHFEVSDPGDLVEVHLSQGAEAYVTPVANAAVGVAILFTPPEGAGGSGGDGPTTFNERLRRFPALHERLETSTPLDQPRGAGPLRQGVRAPVRGRVALVGDAAGYVDALTGQGLELGFAGAAALVDVLASGAPLSRYEQAHARITASYRTGTELLLLATRQRVVRRALVRLLRAAPPVFDRAVSML